MKTSSPGKIFLTMSMAAFIVSCDQKEKPEVDQRATVSSTAALARDSLFSSWTSRAGLQLEMEKLPSGEYFSKVEGRLKDGANQYRAITEAFDGEIYREWAVYWGLNERELFEHEIALLRVGFQRYHTQVFTDSSGVALHQLVMLRRAGDEGEAISPLVYGNRSAVSDEVEPAPKPEPVPDFIQPDLREVDSSVASELGSTLDPVVEERAATSVAEVLETPRSPEVMQVIPDPPKVIEKPLVEVAEGPESGAMLEPKIEEPEAKVEEPKSEEMVEEPKVEEPKPEPKPEPKMLSHRVVKGDTLTGIARRYKVSVAAIKRANGLRSDIIRLKQLLKIPKR